jgi:hypothetical protein
MDAPELRDYLGFLFWHYRVVDSFWFINVEEDRGRAEAERLNERVWEKVSGMAARDLMKRFKIETGGLQGFARLLRLYPWSVLLGYQLEESAEELVLSVPSCATQEARRRRGLDEYECREMHRREFVELAMAVDPRIEVTCEFAPPGERPPGCDCRWRFRLIQPEP